MHSHTHTYRTLVTNRTVLVLPVPAHPRPPLSAGVGSLIDFRANLQPGPGPGCGCHHLSAYTHLQDATVSKQHGSLCGDQTRQP